MISAGEATLGSTFACAQVNPRSVHSDGVRDTALFHQRRHERDRFFVDDHRVVGDERADADGVVDRHQRLDARAELPVVLFAEIEPGLVFPAAA
jgi:hypothetical protein